ncbi:hypothetical protein EUGRSUZ_E00517 [Eucalyptus grandis]|uniref:Uncharacterized protein n=2 Tax=Eucalyptus grandis TaxID=71139 RepID=A0ACC3KST0_EUCGR|nr:hypothetical protein EUGRSUZ_E00517 [Eucalyptus grandis]
MALSSNSFHVLSNVFFDFFPFPSRVLFKPSCVRIANIQTCHRLKSLLPSISSISNLLVELETITRRSRKTLKL